MITISQALCKEKEIQIYRCRPCSHRVYCLVEKLHEIMEIPHNPKITSLQSLQPNGYLIDMCLLDKWKNICIMNERKHETFAANS